MADNLLDKASILLTPTAYNDGSMLSVKPENGDGDFTFSRSSAATRVNAQGLVENVQIISSELVSNGNFSQIGTEEVSNGNFSQEGSELVTNGDFATDSDWTKASNWTISGGSANADGSSGGQLSQTTSPVVVGKTYKIQYTILNYVSGSFRFSYAGTSESFNTSNGTYTTYRVATSTANALASSSISFIGSIDNVSVKEVGQDWSLGTGITIENDKAFFNDSAYPQAIEQTNIATIGKQYKVSFTVSDFQSGNVKLRHPFEVSGVQADGDYVFYGEAASTGITLRGDGVPNNFKIDNISVKEVGQDWILGSGWSIGDGVAVVDNAPNGERLQQNNVFVSGKTYKVTYEITEISQGGFRGYVGGTNLTTRSAVGTYTETLIAPLNDVFYIRTIQTTSGSISNISVKEITDDTDLPRINYEGFSYQDSLGSEEVVNGGFDTDSNWTKGTGWSISGGIAALDGTQIGSSGLGSSIMSVTSGKTYKVVVNVISTSSGFRLYDNSGVIAYGLSVGENVFYRTVTSSSYQVTPLGLSGSTGSIDNISVKEYLGQEVVPDSGCGSWLLEPQSTNLVTQSNQFDTTWNLQNITISSNQNGVGGSVDAWKLIPSTSNSNHRITNSVSGTQNLAVTLSVYAKADGYNFLRITENASTGDYATFNLLDGIVENNTSSEAKIESVGNGWYRCSSSIVATTSHRFDIYVMESATVQEPWSGDGTSGIYIQYAQLESGNLSSYIPTSGAASTRLQDIATNSGNSTLINSTEGVLYYEASYIDGSDYNSISISNNSGSEKLRTWYDNTNLVFANFVNNVNQTFIAYPISKNINYKIAVRYKLNDFALYVNGTKATNIVVNLGGVSPQNSYNKLNFNSGDIYNNFYGKNKALAVYKEALTDSNLRSLTYPNPVATTFDLDFDTIAEQFTFTRGSEATFVNAQGLIESTASNDAPRIDYSTGAKAFLLEPQSTNVLPYSENFSHSSWVKNDVSIQSGYLAPDGTNNAYKVTSTGTNSHLVNVSTGGNTGAKSIYAKTTSGTGTIILFNNVTTYFTITEEWQRFENEQDGLDFFYAADFRRDSTLTEIIIWGAQSEASSYATSYIPTSGASATRNQELCNNATPVINSEEGTLYAEISSLTELNDDERTISLSDGTNINTVRLQFNKVTNNIRVFVGNGTTQVNNNITISDITDFNKLAFKYKENDFALWINGVEVLTDTSGITFTNGTLTKLGFVRGDNSEYFFGNTKGLKYYPKALADVQLEDLTTI